MSSACGAMNIKTNNNIGGQTALEVKVNVINEMKKLRDNTYSDKYTWVDEVIQNCQRSKATHIDVQIEDDKIVISDNGIGCSDPQVLFDKSSSGWDEATTQAESPFGEGFFSTMMAANMITVTSVGFTATFDVNKMFEENNVDVVDVVPNRKKSGFTLVLTDLCPGVFPWTVEHRFREVAKYIKSPTTSINGERVHYEGLTPNSNSPFIRKVDTPYFRGWIEPKSWKNGDWETPTIKCFAFSRHIKDSQKYDGVSGVLNFKEGTIDLRSPDRKEFIFNDKYDDMLKCLEEEIKKMYLRMAKEGSDEVICNFESHIDRYVSLNDYKDYIKFKFLTKGVIDMTSNTSSDNDIDVDNDNITTNGSSDDSGDTYYDGDVNDSPINEIDSAPIATDGDFSTVTKVSSTEIAAKTSTKRRRYSAQTGDSIDKNMQYAFYITSVEKPTYETQIAIAQNYNIPVIEIRNDLELRVVKGDSRINHIRDMDAMMSLEADFKNISPCNIQEVRANKILARIARACNADEDLFRIGDTCFKKVLTINDRQYVIEDVDMMATAYNGKVYINRKHMNAYKNLTDDTSSLNDADIKFILLNLEVLAHEMSHAIYMNPDGTLEHVSCINLLMQKIINLIYGVNNPELAV